MMGRSPKCYIPSFVEIGLLVKEKKIFEGFLPYNRRGGHLCHVIQMPRTDFRSPYPRRLFIKFGFDRSSGFREEDVDDDDGRTTTDARWSMGIL